VSNLHPINEQSLFFQTVTDCPFQPNWYAIHTRSRHEKLVHTQLEAKGITTFLPLVSRVHKWSDRKQNVELPLFPGYAFVHMTPTPDAYYSVLRTIGVAQFVGDGRKGIPIPEKEIDDIRTVVRSKHSFSSHEFFKAGQRVRVRGGCLDGVEGTLVSANSRSLIVSVEIIRKSIAISVDGYDVEPV
jgi:transcription termination/antitermination protein NusG